MGVAIEPRLSENVRLIYADPAMLRQVLHNLFQKRADAPAGVEGPRTVRRAWGRAACSSVRDKRQRIAEAVMGRIQAYVTTNPRERRPGLAIVRKIVDEAPWAILVENVKPHGPR